LLKTDCLEPHSPYKQCKDWKTCLGLLRLDWSCRSWIQWRKVVTSEHDSIYTWRPTYTCVRIRKRANLNSSTGVTDSCVSTEVTVLSCFQSWFSCTSSEEKHNWFNLLNPLKTKRRPLYLKTQSVPRGEHFSSRL